MEKRRLIKKCQSGWRTVNNTRSHGSWGNRGKGNEGESLLENTLSFIKSIPERIDNASRGFKTDAQVIKELGYNPHTHYKMPNGTLAPIISGIAPTPALIKNPTNVVKTKDLNWDYKNWFSKRPYRNTPNEWSSEEIKEFVDRVPLYKNIEKTTKADGTYLKMPNGETWNGDPRAWVQLQTPEGRLYMQQVYSTGVPESKRQFFENKLADRNIWTSRNNPKAVQPYAYDDYAVNTPLSDVELVNEYEQLVKSGELNNANPTVRSFMETSAKEAKKRLTNNKGFVYLFTVPKSAPQFTYNAKGKSYDKIPFKGSTATTDEIVLSHHSGIINFDNIHDTPTPNEIINTSVIKGPIERKSLLGGTGKFTPGKGFFRVVVPVVVGASTEN